MALREAHTYPDGGEPLMVQFVTAWGERSQRSCHLKMLRALGSSSNRLRQEDLAKRVEGPTPRPLREVAASCPHGPSLSVRDLALPGP